MELLAEPFDDKQVIQALEFFEVTVIENADNLKAALEVMALF